MVGYQRLLGSSALTLFVLGLDADDPHNAFATNNFAVFTHATDACTYFHLNTSMTVSNPTFGQIVGTDIHGHPITRQDANIVHAHLT